jgi:serine/threonine-protein kinase
MKVVPIRAPAAVPQKNADAGARHELDRVLASATFRQADRLKRFLSFIVCEALEGRGDQLKEYVIGVQVFDKDSSFDPRADPIVRVQARRLRSRLERYYREVGGTDAIVIELPKGGYAPVFRNRDAAGGGRRTTGPALAGQNTIAVLPLADHSAARDLSYFCDGLRQEIIHRLATVKALRVLALQPSAINGAAEGDGNHRQVAMLLTGGVRKSGDRLRATIHLVDSATASYLWSESLDLSLADVFGAQESVADAVVTKLEPRLVDAGQRRGSRRPSENLAAHNLYLQGRYQMNQRTEEGLRKAVDFFERAIVEDSHYALAHSGLADAYGLLTHYGVFGPADVWTKAASSAASAVMLDPDSSEAHTSLAHVKSTQDWDWSGAEREFQLAIRLDTGYATAHHWYAMSCLVPMGRLDEAFDQMLLRTVARPRLVNRRARSRARPSVQAGLRSGARAVRPCHRAQPAFLTRLLGARSRAGAAQGFRRGSRRLSTRHSSFAADAADAGGAGPDVRARGQAQRIGGNPAPPREPLRAALHLTLRVREHAFRARTNGRRLPLVHESVRGPIVRAAVDARRSAARSGSE